MFCFSSIYNSKQWMSANEKSHTIYRCTRSLVIKISRNKLSHPFIKCGINQRTLKRAINWLSRNRRMKSWCIVDSWQSSVSSNRRYLKSLIALVCYFVSKRYLKNLHFNPMNYLKVCLTFSETKLVVFSVHEKQQLGHMWKSLIRRFLSRQH